MSEDNGSVLEPKKQILDALKLCYDPEIPVDVVELGLIYGLEFLPDTGEVNIQMTLTSAGCPMSDYIIDQIKTRISTLPFVKQVNVELVFDPPWERSMISMQAKLELGML